jgi:hypothetical protein
MPKKSVVIAPPTPQEITRVAKALYAAAHVNEAHDLTMEHPT